MSIFKTRHVRAILALCCLGLPPPGLTQASTEAPWDDSPAPFVLHGASITVAEDRRVERGLQLEGASGFQVADGRTLWLRGPVLGHPADALIPVPFWKLGGGHLELAGAGTLTGQIVLAEGSLGLANDDALGAPGNSLEMAAGTRLELRPGVRVGQVIQVRSAATAQTPPAHWGLAPIAGLSSAAVWRVASGEATLAGSIQADAPIIKDGAGTLRLTGIGFSSGREPLILAQGGLRVDQLWWGPILTQPGTVLSGVGQVDEARVAGLLQPGAPGRTGTLLIGQRLALLPQSQTRIRIDADGQADRIWSFGTARLGGELLVEPVSGAWTPARRWTIVQADGGLEYGADGGGDPVPGDGRYVRAASALRYLAPVLDYGPTTVTLGLRYNARGLNTADAAWRGALLDDSRFPREAALAHTAGGRAWVQTWAANTERSGIHGLPGDDRDTSGLQIGASRPVGTGGFLAAFMGTQETRLATVGTTVLSPSAVAGGAYHLRDRSMHLGLGASLARQGWRLTLGAAQSWHRAGIRRQADPAESPLRSQPAARLTQAWLHVQPDMPVNPGAWQLTPYARAVWLRLHRPAVDESGGLAAVALDARTDRRWVGQLGVRVERPWPTSHGDALMTLDLGVRRLWGGSTLSSPQAYRADPGRRFEAEGLPVPRHALHLDLGVQAPIARRVQVTLAYTGQHGGGQVQHGVWLGVRGGFR
ncbi:autotransporter outer membrane beta-barrel domain-containing protein [Castellaniella sp.]|uniref:autotransporter outer membrane beta-barrel domain-containing protein n=1 Tax=Castellaniella sp. TaxID=1955812 RepID=UPI002AFEB572|nr:autotransporter outer membrane beta-barrel domain-containing protein [Castellaniella sp.]